MALLDQCSWTHPDPNAVTKGQVFSFAAAVPPAIPTAGLVDTVLDTATASTISWLVTDTSTPPQPLAPGTDFQVVSGGLDQPQLSFVVNPSRTAAFKVQPILTVAGGGPPIFSTSSPNWNAVTFTPVPTSASDLQGQVKTLLEDTLELTSSADLLEPGAAATLQVVQKQLTATPQVVTNVVHELPKVEITGAIPLGALVQAVIGPLVGAISRALPSAADPLSQAEGQVAALLAEPLPIPLAFEVSGRKVTNTLAPLTANLATTVTSAAGDPSDLTGSVPVGGFLAKFHLQPSVTPTWTVTENGQPSKALNMSPGLNLVQTLLPLPKVVPLGSAAADLAPIPIQVSVSLKVELPDLGLTSTNAVTVNLGPITLLKLPLALPQITAVFTNALDDWNYGGGQSALLSTDNFGAALLPSLDAMLRLLGTLSSVLDTLTSAAFALGSTDADWTNLQTLGQGVRLIVTLFGKLTQDRLYYQPVYAAGAKLQLKHTWNDSISAVIHVGVPLQNGRGKWFRLSDSNGSGVIDFNGPNASTAAFISIMGTLDGAFSTLPQWPAGTAVSNSPNTNFNDILEVLEFPSA